MKYLDEFRDSRHAEKLLLSIRELASQRWTIMEVCGGQTHNFLRYGIHAELKDEIELVHGPGCPVCVTPISKIDLAVELALQKNFVLASFGDMIRVPGTRFSLQEVRAHGGNVRMVYSPLDALDVARSNPDQKVVFFAVGFETTAPATALALLQAEKERIENFFVLVSHVRVQPAMESLLSDSQSRIQAFLAAGHVCTVSGFQSYESLIQKYRVPIVVTGFEPTDLLVGLHACVQQLESGKTFVENCYGRSVAADGNVHAQRLIDEVYEVTDCEWRGFGSIPNGGLGLSAAFQKYNAETFGNKTGLTPQEQAVCQSADVLAGRIKPTECKSFGTHCRPETPLGAPMVSSEGACAAYFRFPQI